MVIQYICINTFFLYFSENHNDRKLINVPLHIIKSHLNYLIIEI